MKKLFLLILSFLGLTACVGAQDKNYNDMDIEDFARYIDNEGVQLVDVRTPEEYAAGRIAGADNIDIRDSGFIGEAEKKLDKSRPVAVYCRSGKRSADAAGVLTGNGFKVVNLKGGILAWEKAGLPVQK